MAVMRVLIQRSSDRSFLKTTNVWVQSRQEALSFPNCTPAIDYCVEHHLAGVRLWLSFDDPEYDFPMEVFRAQTRVLVNYKKDLRSRQRQLMADLDRTGAEAKERKRQFEFPRRPIGVGDQPQPPVAPDAAAPGP